MDGRVGERASYSVNIYIYIIYLRNPVRTSSKLKKKKNMQPEPTENNEYRLRARHFHPKLQDRDLVNGHSRDCSQ